MAKITEYLPGQTPLNPDFKKDLIPGHIELMAELNEYEASNIAKALQKYLLSRKKNWPIEDPIFIKQLHREMFDQTWKWAGTYRRHETNIGSPWRTIETGVKDACDDLSFWIENEIFPRDQIAIRFHHRLIAIHPFPNGNGRHGRLVADLLMRRFLLAPLSWGSKNIMAPGTSREFYLAAMKKADGDQFEDLMFFAKS